MNLISPRIVVGYIALAMSGAGETLVIKQTQLLGSFICDFSQ
jgi:hypothetical protein